MGDMYTSIRFLKKYMPCNHKRVWEMCTARTGIRKDFSLRNPFDQADFKELYKDVFRKSEKEILLEDGWEPYATEDGITHFKRLKPCEECGKEMESHRKTIGQMCKEEAKRMQEFDESVQQKLKDLGLL